VTSRGRDQLPADVPFDGGLQTERTLLAWRRTCLALGVGSAVVVRLMAPQFGLAVVPVGLAGAAVAGVAYLSAGRRYRAAHRSLASTSTLTSGGRTLAGVVLVVLLLALAGLGYVVEGAVRS